MFTKKESYEALPGGSPPPPSLLLCDAREKKSTQTRNIGRLNMWTIPPPPPPPPPDVDRLLDRRREVDQIQVMPAEIFLTEATS
ncbi:hypothetical protein GCM10020219_004520 [Nonomuraea dietziae]